MKLKINNVRGFEGVITIKTDKNKLPLEKFWRDRLKDAEHDQCVTILSEPSQKVNRGKSK